MRPSAKSEKRLRVAFVTLLVVCAAQVAWWLFDQVQSTDRERARWTAQYERDARALGELLAPGAASADVTALFPELRVDATGVVSVDPAVLAALDDARAHRLNRYGWEGAFFLVVLFGATALIGRVVAEEGRLRRAQQDLLASVSHEFKSPLAALRLSLETLLLREPASEARARLGQRALTDLDRLETTVTNILDGARLDEGRVRLAPERIALARVARACTDAAADRAAAVGARVAVAVPPELAVEADPLAARTVLRNLLDNALEAVAARGGGEVEISARALPRQIELSVRDTGEGFPAEEAERLFEKFERGPGRERGTGLGLYIVRRFAELGGGSARGQSDGPGRGATFTVAWPRAAEASA